MSLVSSQNSTSNVIFVSISWFIFYANHIFSLYAFPFADSEDDEECSNDLIANGWIFNTPSHSAFLNSFSVFIILKNFTSSSYLCLCSLLCASFSFVILYNFSITLFAFMLMWIPELWKCSQLPATTKTTFNSYPFISCLNFSPVAFIFLMVRHL
jgi:hypothetical protein